VIECFRNRGQTCDAPTRLLAESACYHQVLEYADAAGNAQKIDIPTREGGHIGPLVSQVQFDRVEALLEVGINEGTRPLCGGPGKPEGFERGYYVKPTILAAYIQTGSPERPNVLLQGCEPGLCVLIVTAEKADCSALMIIRK
jgi:aldehyde dehydrogenase (NAD+)